MDPIYHHNASIEVLCTSYVPAPAGGLRCDLLAEYQQSEQVSVNGAQTLLQRTVITSVNNDDGVKCMQVINKMSLEHSGGHLWEEVSMYARVVCPSLKEKQKLK